jgi:Tol biopolymer transport system component
VVDIRTDVFSLGAVLHEMATGRPAFSGTTAPSLYDAIVNRGPAAVTDLNPELPSKLGEIVAKAMARDRDMRYQSAADLRADLARLKLEADSAPGSPPSFSRSARKRKWFALMALVLLPLVAAAVWRLFQKGSADAVSVPHAVPFTSFPGHETDPAFSPDGSKIAFAWDGEDELGRNGAFSIYVQMVGESTPLRLTRGRADRHPVWTPDGRDITFVRGTGQNQKFEIQSVPEAGGPERTVTALERSREPRISWSPDGKQLALTDGTEGESESVFLLDAGGTRRRLTTPDGNAIDSDPAFSPDGRTVSFVRRTGSLSMDLYSVPISGTPVTRLTRANTVIATQIWSADGSRIFYTLQKDANLSLWTIRASGGIAERVPNVPDSIDTPAIAPKGGRLAYRSEAFNENIWRFDLPNSPREPARPPTKWIASSRTQDSPQFSPDGKKLAFVSTRSGSAEIWVSDVNGSQLRRLTSVGGYRTGSPRWSPDSAKIVFDSRPHGKPDIYAVNAQGGEPTQLTSDPAENVVPSWSHDGRWIYFSSKRTGQFQVWRMPATGVPALQITHHGGFEPLESPDGAFLYYTKNKGVAGVWRVPSAGGEETPVPELATAGFPRYWTVAAGGVYFVPQAEKAVLHLFDFETRQVRQLLQFPRPPVSSLPGLAVSPDGRWLLYSQVDEDNADIIILENFR